MDDETGLDPVMLDLLVEWEERKAAGTPATPEELCRTCPERVDDLRRHIARMDRLNPLLTLADGGTRPSIPGFELLEEVGRGGMGVVFRAKDQQLDRIVAVKVPFTAAGGLSSERFEREARTLAKLRHPSIVPVYAAGVAGGTPYLVMEYIPGGSLAGRMAEVVRTPAQAATLVTQVAEAVDHAHAAGIVHRDLKPANILLTETGRPVVSDFGVAALLAGEPLADPAAETPDDSRPTRLTRTGAVVGTPAYTAPECSQGPPTPSADVWSLGVILYQCLTGRLPYPDGLPIGIPVPPPPRPRAVRPGVPHGLEAVALRCLATDPTARYPTAAAVAAALRPRFPWRALLVGVLAVLLAAVGVAFTTVWFSPEARFQRQVTAAQTRLKETGRLDLLTAGADRKALAVKRWGAEASDLRQDADGLIIETTRAVSLVELLAVVPAERFTIRATILPRMLQNGNLAFGVMCKYATFTSDAGPQHTLHGLIVSNDPQGNSTSALLGPWWFGQGTDQSPRDERLLLTNDRRPDFYKVFPGAIRSQTWDLTVRVTPAGVTGSCTRSGDPEETFGTLTAADHSGFLRRIWDKYPDTKPFTRQTETGSGVGLMVGYGSCAVQRFEVELANPTD